MSVNGGTRRNPTGKFGTPALILLIGAAFGAQAFETYVPGDANDPRVRVADYLAGNNRYLSAASQLLEIQNESPETQLAPGFYKRLADYTLSFGLTQRAEVIYGEQVARNRDESRDQARARLRLSEFSYDRGYYPEAVEQLMGLREHLPQPVVEDWQDLLARAFAAQGQYGEAADVLQKPGTAAPDSAFALYNLGVSLVNDGRVTQGLTILDRVGRMSVSDSESMALRDKANLTLGYHFLRSQQGATAVPIFNRVRSEGPYSNRALLGLGWAYLAPSGSRQRKAQLTDNDYDQPGFSSFSTLGALLRPGFLDSNIYQRAGMRPFLLDRMPKNQEAALRRALVPWVELLSRDPMDPAVQEGMLAIPYALDQLNAHTQAKDYYEKAIPALEETRQRLDQAMDHIKSGRMLETIIKRDADAEAGWTWKLKDLPDAPETFYLQSLLAENRYQEVLKDYRDARMLVRSLDARRNRIGELQHSYAERRAVDIPVELLFLQTKKRYGTVRYKLDPPPLLRLDKSMSPHSDANLPAAGNPPAAIRLDERMPLFDGPYERMQAVAERIDALRPQLDANANALAKILQGIAERDLGAQKKINEKYLIEARFALARVYDRGTPGDQQ